MSEEHQEAEGAENKLVKEIEGLLQDAKSVDVDDPDLIQQFADDVRAAAESIEELMEAVYEEQMADCAKTENGDA